MVPSGKRIRISIPLSKREINALHIWQSQIQKMSQSLLKLFFNNVSKLDECVASESNLQDKNGQYSNYLFIMIIKGLHLFFMSCKGKVIYYRKNHKFDISLSELVQHCLQCYEGFICLILSDAEYLNVVKEVKEQYDTYGQIAFLQTVNNLQ